MRTIAALILMTGPAFAECPDASHMKTGVVFTLDDGGTELHRVTRPDWIQVFALFPEGDASLLDLYHGLYLKADVPVYGGVPQIGETLTYATEDQLRVWPAPVSNSTWSNETEGGGLAKSGDPKIIALGDCQYEAFDIEIVFADDLGYRETYRYLPELRTAMLVATSDSEGTEEYVYTRIHVNTE